MTTVTVCVPAYNAAGRIADTLESVAGQTFADFRVVISLDRSDDDSESVCRRYLADPRFQLVVQRERLGWVGNVNALIARVETPFFCILPHDDVLSPTYLASLYQVARADTGVSCVYSDIRGFGSEAPAVVQEDIRGPQVDRVLDFFVNHFGAVAFRGLVRTGSPDDRPYLPTGIRRDFAADTVWLLTLALRGELRRVPEPLYAKRYGPDTVHAAWHRWPRDEMLRLWGEQAATCARIAVSALDRHRDLLLAAALFRALGIGKVAPGFPPPAGPLERAAVMDAFTGALGDLRIPADLPALLGRHEARLLRVAIKDRIWHERRPSLAERLRWRLFENSCIDDLRYMMA